MFVETGKEEKVKTWLYHYFSEDDLAVVIPKRKLIEKKNGIKRCVIRPLFNSYILFYTQMNILKYKIIKNLPNVINILGTGCYYSKIPECEMAFITKLINKDGIVELSKIYLEGNKIIIKSGPLKGFDGIIDKINKRNNRAKIRVNFMETVRFIDVGIEILVRRV
jgi:transcriptional antiterminator NusG